MHIDQKDCFYLQLDTFYNLSFLINNCLLYYLLKMLDIFKRLPTLRLCLDGRKEIGRKEVERKELSGKK